MGKRGPKPRTKLETLDKVNLNGSVLIEEEVKNVTNVESVEYEDAEDAEDTEDTEEDESEDEDEDEDEEGYEEESEPYEIEEANDEDELMHKVMASPSGSVTYECLDKKKLTVPVKVARQIDEKLESRKQKSLASGTIVDRGFLKAVVVTYPSHYKFEFAM